MLYLCIAIEKNNGSIAQLNRAFDYGSKGYRFESYWSHSKQETNICSSLFFFLSMGLFFFGHSSSSSLFGEIV